MSKSFIRRVAIAIVLLFTFISIYICLRRIPDLFDYMTVGANGFVLAVLVYWEVENYRRKKLHIKNVIAKAVKIAPSLIEKGIPEAEAMQFALGIYLSCTTEYADLLMSAYIEGRMEDVLSLVSKKIESECTIYRNYPPYTTQPQLRKAFGAKFGELVGQTDAEIRRLGWTFDEIENHLMGLYNARSRFLLTEAQLEDFLLYLQSHEEKL